MCNLKTSVSRSARCGVSALAMLGAVVMSQAAAAQAAGAQSDESGAADQTVLQDIVVTAQRRSENLQNVPIAVTALGGEQLATQGIGSITDLGQIVPSLSVSNAVGFGITTLRGVGSSAIGPGIETPISIYLDGIYYASSTAAQFDLVNIERVEVLKGPQGTLFGRNATGGLIQVFTRDPGNDVSVIGHLGYGNYETVSGDLYASGPVSDTLGADFSVRASGMGKGYGKNLFNGDDVLRNSYNVAVRSKWVWNPGADTKVTLIGDYTKSSNSFNAGRIPSDQKPPAYLGVPAYGGSVWDTSNDKTPHLYNRNYGFSLKFDQSLGFADLSNIVAYRNSLTRNIFDVDFTSVPFLNGDPLIQDEQQFSEEIRISSLTSSALKWQTGVYYFRARGKYDPNRAVFPNTNPALNPIFPLGAIVTYGNQLTESVAGYAQATYEFLPDTNLTLGARYTYEKRTIEGRDEGELLDGTSIGVLAAYPKDSLTFKKPTFRVALDHRLSPELMVFASFNTGFKSGGYNTQTPGADPFRPETLNAIEAGFKADLLDRRLRFNLNAYRYDYKDVQVQKVVFAATGIINGASARIWGIEAEMSALLAPGLKLSASGAYSHARYRDFPVAPISSPGGGVPIFAGPVSGNDIPKAPDFQGVLSADYSFAVGNGQIALNAFYSYNSGFYMEPDNMYHQSSFDRVNLSATWSSSDERYSIKGWVKNLTNAEVLGYAVSLPDGTREAQYEAPRTYGVTLGFKY